MPYVGQLDFEPQDPLHPERPRKLEHPFGFLRPDGYLVVAPRGATADGASIPRFFWRLFGHPFRHGNRFWSVPHDAGYKGEAMIINMAHPEVRDIDPAIILAHWSMVPSAAFVHSADLTRRWWDETMLQAMTASGTNAIKRRCVYRAVRLFGRRNYRRNLPTKTA